MGLFDWFRSKPACPIEQATREWINRRWSWLEQEFGVERVRSLPVVLPCYEFFPEPYHGTEADARQLLDRVCDYMKIDPATIYMSLYDESNAMDSCYQFAGISQEGTAGLFHPEGVGFRIWVEVNNLADPLAMVGTIAHELGHVHLLGHGRISPDEEDHEPLTDLLTVFLGMGVFTSNSVVREKHWRDGQFSGWSISRQGYLRMPDYGYAFAKFAQSRGEDGSAWSRELRLDVRAAFKQSMRFLAAEAAVESGPSGRRHDGHAASS
jgi:hypothetical protein